MRGFRGKGEKERRKSWGGSEEVSVRSDEVLRLPSWYVSLMLPS